MLSCCVLLTACAGRAPPSVPTAATATSPAKNEIYIVVQRGQTLDAVADRFHVTKADIIALNDLKPPYRLKPGGVLKLPVAAQLDPGTQEDEGPATPPRPARAATTAATTAPPAQAPRPARPKTSEKPKPSPQVIPLD
jgi:LysM repeat protein